MPIVMIRSCNICLLLFLNRIIIVPVMITRLVDNWAIIPKKGPVEAFKFLEAFRKSTLRYRVAVCTMVITIRAFLISSQIDNLSIPNWLVIRSVEVAHTAVPGKKKKHGQSLLQKKSSVVNYATFIRSERWSMSLHQSVRTEREKLQLAISLMRVVNAYTKMWQSAHIEATLLTDDIIIFFVNARKFKS